MPKLSIHRTSGLPAEEVFARVSSFLAKDPDLLKLDPEFKCVFDSASLSGTATGRQFSANLSVEAAATPGSNLALHVELPFHLGLVKSLIQKTLEKKLDKVLS